MGLRTFFSVSYINDGVSMKENNCHLNDFEFIAILTSLYLSLATIIYCSFINTVMICFATIGVCLLLSIISFMITGLLAKK